MFLYRGGSGSLFLDLGWIISPNTTLPFQTIIQAAIKRHPQWKMFLIAARHSVESIDTCCVCVCLLNNLPCPFFSSGFFKARQANLRLIDLLCRTWFIYLFICFHTCRFHEKLEKRKSALIKRCSAQLTERRHKVHIHTPARKSLWFWVSVRAISCFIFWLTCLPLSFSVSLNLICH